MSEERYNIRHLARIVLQAETPIAVGSGEKDVETDARVIKDVNGLPYIPATSIAGVLRHAMGESEESNTSEVWGYQLKGSKSAGKGSRLIFTGANLVDADGKVVDGILSEQSAFHSRYHSLPIRQHAKINHKGTTEDGGKFDEEIVFKGTRFCFEVEMLAMGSNPKSDYFKALLSHIASETLRIGGGTRSGFGEMRVVSCKTRTLTFPDGLKEYIEKSSSLSDDSFWVDVDDIIPEGADKKDFVKETLTITPLDFFLFGSGHSDDDADMTPVSESCVVWKGNYKGEFENNNILIPATSVKGALSHRVAYHYNLLKGIFSDSKDVKIEEHVGKKNFAVRVLFGNEGDGTKGGATRGNILISDIIEKKGNQPDKLLNHVAIDRFTGGAIDGALFTEKVTDEHDHKFQLDVVVDRETVKTIAKDDAPFVFQALDAALNDLCHGLLPLGGGVNRGNGVFEGLRMADDFFTKKGKEE